MEELIYKNTCSACKKITEHKATLGRPVFVECLNCGHKHSPEMNASQFRNHVAKIEKLVSKAPPIDKIFGRSD